MSSFDESIHTFLDTFTIRPDGSDRHVVPMPDEGGGRWSHAGNEIAVSAVLDDGRIGTAIITPDGTVERVLDIAVPTLNLPCTVWSPDDQRLACEGWDEAAREAHGDLHRAKAATAADSRESPRRRPDRPTSPATSRPTGPGSSSRGRTTKTWARCWRSASTEGSRRRWATASSRIPGRYSPDGSMICTSSAAPSWCWPADGAVVSTHRRVRLLPLRAGVVAGRDPDRVLPHDHGRLSRPTSTPPCPTAPTAARSRPPTTTRSGSSRAPC